MSLNLISARAASFTGQLPVYGATLSGVITQVGTTVHLTSATVVIGGVSRAIAYQSFSQL
jgi:hypothetical protein